MHLPISGRLLACAEYVRQGDVVADIGCDHGYLGIHLLTNRIAKRVIASDIKKGPLQAARNNAIKYGVTDRMSFHLGSGVSNVPQDFDVMVCAGMGADTMIHILESAPWLKSDKYTLILQCQSKTPMLRRYLSDNGWKISEESALRDGRFLYTIMAVTYCPAESALTADQCYFSPALLRNPSEDVGAYYKWVVEGLRIATAHQDDPEKKQILAQLELLEQEVMK